MPGRVHGHHEPAARGDHPESRHIHAAHFHIIRKPDDIRPGKQDKDHKTCRHDRAITPEDSRQRRVVHDISADDSVLAEMDFRELRVRIGKLELNGL